MSTSSLGVVLLFLLSALILNPTIGLLYPLRAGSKHKRLLHFGKNLGNARRRRDQQHLEQYISFLEQCASLLRAGRTLTTMWADLGADHPQPQPLRDLAAHVATWADSGWGVAAAVAEFSRANPATGPLREAISELGAVLTVAERSGAPIVAVLESLAAHYEQEIELAAARACALAGPQATGALLTWLPLLGLGMAALTGVDLTRALSSPLGVLALTAGASLWFIGRLWVRHLITRAGAPCS